MEQLTGLKESMDYFFMVVMGAIILFMQVGLNFVVESNVFDTSYTTEWVRFSGGRICEKQECDQHSNKELC